MAAHSTAWGAGCAHREALGRLRLRERIACQENHAAAAAKTARQTVPGTGLSPGSNIPAIATPIRTCRPSASSSVSRPRRRPMASRPAQQTAISIMSAANIPASHPGPVTPGPFEPPASRCLGCAECSPPDSLPGWRSRLRGCA